MRIQLLAVSVAALLFAGCPKEPVEEEEDGGGAPPPDVCNSKEDALTNAQCQLTLGQTVQDYIGAAGDQDYYLLTTPANVTPRSLVHITAGYGVPSTAVQLSVNVLREDGTTSLARAVDLHGQAAPKPVDIVFPFSEPNAKLLLLLGDQPATPTRPQFDVRSPYTLKAEVVENPDVNEPNDVNPTTITLAAQNGIQQGQQVGYLATPDDIDKFTVTVPSGSDILYLHLTGPNPQLNPPPPFRISYTLINPQGTSIAEGRVASEFNVIDLATARKVTPGAYTVVVQGYRGQTTTGAIPGDVRLQYTLEARALKDADVNEPNDSAASPTTINFSGLGPRTVTGRISYVPDSDWYQLVLPAQSQPTSLHWKVTPGTAGGRFPALPGELDRQVRVLQDVVGANASSLCKDDSNTCPKNYENNPLNQSLVEGYCAGATPRCLYAARQENLQFQALRNFEGVLQIPPHSGSVSLYFLIEDKKNDWADDKDYSIDFDWEADSDEAARYSGSTEQPSSLTMNLDNGASYPAPTTPTTLTGTLWGGFGRLVNNDPNTGNGVRGPEDYEAQPTDIDSYVLSLPAVSAPEDRTWAIEWSVDKSNGATVHDISLEVQFCDGSGGGCQKVPSSPGQFGLVYQGGDLASWHGQSMLQPAWDRTETTSSVTVTARAYACLCLERRFMQGGQLFLRVVGIDRDAYVPVTYRVRTSLTDYPKTYSGVGGEGTLTCPAPFLGDAGTYEGGCGFEP